MKIKIVWILFCFVHDSMALAPGLTVDQPPDGPADPSLGTDPSLDTDPTVETGTQTGGGDTTVIPNKPVFCEYLEGVEPLLDGLNCIPFLSPECIPAECQVLVFPDFTISNTSEITCNTDLLKSLTAVRPVIVAVYRTMGYNDWSSLLASDSYENDINALLDFARENDIKGYRLEGLSPQCFDDVLDVNVAENIVPYIDELRNSGLVVGVMLDPYASVIKNPCVTNCEALNDVVDFYEINTISMNDCNLTYYNGMSPISYSPHGPGYMLSVEEAVMFFDASKCSKDKLYLDVELYPFDNLSLRYFISYSDICTGYTSEDMCKPDTKQYFSKGYFIRLQCAGINIRYVNLDDTQGSCGCGPFVALKNTLAGYYDQDMIPCSTYDGGEEDEGSM